MEINQGNQLRRQRPHGRRIQDRDRARTQRSETGLEPGIARLPQRSERVDAVAHRRETRDGLAIQRARLLVVTELEDRRVER